MHHKDENNRRKDNYTESEYIKTYMTLELNTIILEVLLGL